MKINFKKIISTIIIVAITSSNVQAAVILDSNGNIVNNTTETPDNQAVVVPTRSNILLGEGNNNGVLGAGLSDNPYNPNSAVLDPDVINKQIQNTVLATQASATSSTAQTNSTVAKNVTGLTTCLGSQIVAQAIVDNVSKFATGAISQFTDSLINVPTAESGSVGSSIKTETSARIGSSVDLFGLSIPTLPSWDAMAYCIVNTMIIYIADSTIEWVNTGFDGNPAFLNNPDQFFKDLANQEKVAFIQGIAYGVNSNICGVFKSSIVSAVLSRYNKNQERYGQQGYQTGGYGGGGTSAPISSCPFDQKPGQINAFLTGGFSQGGGWETWFEVTQNPMSNPYYTYFNTNDKLNQQVEAIKISNERELNWNNGYLSFKSCPKDEKDKTKCVTTTPGSLVQNQLDSTLNLGKNRLVLAEKFDQVVTAVVDQLITTAIDKALDRDSYSYSNTTNSQDYTSTISTTTSSASNPWLKTTKPYRGEYTTNFASTTSTTNNNQ